MPLSLQGNDQLAEAGTVCPKSVAENDAGFSCVNLEPPSFLVFIAVLRYAFTLGALAARVPAPSTL